MATATVCNPIAYTATTGYESGNFYRFDTNWSEQDATYSHCQGNYSPNAVQSPTAMTLVKVRLPTIQPYGVSLSIVCFPVCYCEALCSVCGWRH